MQEVESKLFGICIPLQVDRLAELKIGIQDVAYHGGRRCKKSRQSLFNNNCTLHDCFSSRAVDRPGKSFRETRCQGSLRCSIRQLRPLLLDFPFLDLNTLKTLSINTTSLYYLSLLLY